MAKKLFEKHTATVSWAAVLGLCLMSGTLGCFKARQGSALQTPIGVQPSCEIELDASAVNLAMSDQDSAGKWLPVKCRNGVEPLQRLSRYSWVSDGRVENVAVVTILF